MIKKLNSLKAVTQSMKISIFEHGVTSNLSVRKVLEIPMLPWGLLKEKWLTAQATQNADKEKIKPISIVVIIKNEGLYIKEWIEYHKIIGIKKFYIYDNNSTDNTYKLLKPYIERHQVIYKKLNGKIRQLDAYNDALKYGRKNHELLLMIDADEFLFIKNPNIDLEKTINEFFLKNPQVGGIGINWLIFGSSHYLHKPQGLVTQNFIYRSKFMFDVNYHIKTLCDPTKVAGFLNPHYPEYLSGYYSVNVDEKKINGAFSKPIIDPPIRINHYFTKSKEEFMKKRQRGMADNNRIRNYTDFEKHDRNDVLDKSMLRYSNQMKDIFGK